MRYSRKSFLKVLGIGAGISLASLPSLAFTASNEPIIKPKKLKKGDTIGMISPASSLPEEKEYGEVVNDIEKLGFKVKVGLHAKDHYGYLAGTDQHRADDLNTMFADPEVDGIIPFRGGWGCNRILDLIDYDIIKLNPKPLIGFSDITSLLLSIYAKTGLITYHGPVGTSNWSKFTKDYFRKALMNSATFTMQNKGHKSGVTTIRSGKATGRLLGGNLSVLTAMMGSNYLPNWDGAILFIEDIGEDIYRIDRMITQLELNGIFDQIDGLIFGKCSECEVDTAYHFTLEEVVSDHIKPYNIPAYIGANIGHIKNIFTLPIGLVAKMDADNGTIRLLQNPIAESS